MSQALSYPVSIRLAKISYLQKNLNYWVYIFTFTSLDLKSISGPQGLEKLYKWINGLKVCFFSKLRFTQFSLNSVRVHEFPLSLLLKSLSFDTLTLAFRWNVLSNLLIISFRLAKLLNPLQSQNLKILTKNLQNLLLNFWLAPQLSRLKKLVYVG